MARIMDAVESYPLPASVAEEGTIRPAISPPRRRGHRRLGIALATAGIATALASAGVLGLRALTAPLGEQSRAVSAASEPIPPQDGLTRITGEPPPKPPEIPAVAPPPDTAPAASSSVPVEKVKPYDNGIVSPEAYTAGEFIEWSVQGAIVRGMGFILEKGEKLRIPEDLQVATDEYPKPHTYNGHRIAGISDGRRLTFIGAVSASDGLTDVGKNLSGGTVVGTINSSTPVLEGAKYNLVMLSSEEERVKRFPDQTKNPPKKINNTFTAPAPGGLTLHDRKPPQ